MGDFQKKKQSRFGFSGKYCILVYHIFWSGMITIGIKVGLKSKRRERGGLVCIRTEEYELLPAAPCTMLKSFKKCNLYNQYSLK